ncbi:MAG: helix-turn-helix transcriptional regulator [Bacillota bacterium]
MLRFYKLFDLLARRGHKKMYLIEELKLAPATVAKLSKGDSINSDVIDRLCAGLQVQPGDIMEHISESEED